MENTIRTSRLAHRQGHRPSPVPFMFCLLITSLFYLTAPISTACAATAVTYYLDAVNGDDSWSGKAPSWNGTDGPWKTIEYAEENAAPASSIKLKTGNYGVVHITQQSVSRTSWNDALTFTPADGASPVIKQLNIEALTTETAIDRYMIFDGLTFYYPQADVVDGYTNIISSESDSYLKFLNCTIYSVLGVDGEGEYWQGAYSVQDGMQLGRSNYGGISNITVDNCIVHDIAEVGIRIGGVSNGNMILSNNDVYHIGHAELKIEGTSNSEILLQGNELHDQYPVWNTGHTTIHHTSSIYIAAHHVNIQNNIVRGGGSTNPITTYQEIYDGGVRYKNGTLGSNDHEFTPGETVTQEVTGAVGIIHEYGTAAHPTELRIYRSQNENLFDEEHNIVSDTNALVIYTPGEFYYTPRAWGGYQDITVQNNLIYDSRQKFYCNYFQDIGQNFKFNHNTVIGCHLHDPYNYEGVSYYKNAFRCSPVSYGYDSNTVEICNNIFLGYFAGGFLSGNEAVAGNIFYAYLDGTYKDQDWIDTNLPGNKVYNWDQGDKTAGQSTFNTSGSFFVGGSSFDTYHATRGEDNWPHQQDLGNSYALSSSSDAVNYGDPENSPISDILGVSRVFPPDAGCYEYAADPNNQAPVLQEIGDKFVNENTLSIFTVKATDANGDDVANITYSIQNEPSGATFENGFFSWTPSYDQAGTYDSVRFIADDNQGAQDFEDITITVKNVNRPPVAVDDNATVAQDSGANAIDVLANDLDADGDTLTITAVTQPSHGDAVITGGGTGLTYTPVANYNGSDSFTYTVSDANGGTNTATVTIIVNPGNQAPSAHAGVDQTLTDNDGNGSELVNLHGSGSTDPDGTIESWVWSDDRGDTILAGETTTPTLSVGTHTITLTATDDDGATDTDTVTVTINALDSTAPSVINYSPTDAAAQVPLNNLIILHILDDNSGVDVNSVTIKVNDDVVYTGNTTDYSSAWGHCRRTGTIADFTFVYQADQMFDFDQAINVTVNAADICGNAMVEHSHSFETEMFSFGENKNINADGLSKNYPATVQDSGGNIWAAWHAGATGSRDIYIAKLAAGAGSFAGSIRLTNAAADQCNPAVAIDADDKLYVLWQDNTQGNWDILIRTSADGAAWSAQRTVTDSNDNQTNPAVVVDGSLSRNVSVAWQDDRPGNTDIYIAVSGNDFVTKTTSQITSHTANQSEPAITADASNTIYVVWTDQRNGSNDIYGASSNIGPWTEVAVVTKSNSQSSPAIAAEQTGSILHLLWADDISGDSDIYYASSDGLPSSPLTGTGIVDDTTGADQSQPAIVVTGSTGNSLKVFASWKDERNVSSSGDTDLYLVQIGSDENVFVGDDGTNSNQSKPALGVDAYGYPYLLWADSRAASPSIYYAGTTFVQSAALASNDVTASSGATVGTDPAAISSADDVSVIVPAGACSSDLKITISKVENPPKFDLQRLSVPYDFGPSGIEFSQPVTITIPYTVPADGQYASAYWYNPLTGALSQQGITDVSSTQISPSLYALHFKTTHFSQFIVGGGTVGSDGVSGGGGCSMSPSGQADLKEYLLPYIALAAVMLVLKLRDARRRRLQSTIRGGR